VLVVIGRGYGWQHCIPMLDVELVIEATCTLGAADGVVAVLVLLLLPQSGPCGTRPACRGNAASWSTSDLKQSPLYRAQPLDLLRHSNAKGKE
jgi:hypothetical protein